MMACLWRVGRCSVGLVVYSFFVGFQWERVVVIIMMDDCQCAWHCYKHECHLLHKRFFVRVENTVELAHNPHGEHSQ